MVTKPLLNDKYSQLLHTRTVEGPGFEQPKRSDARPSRLRGRARSTRRYRENRMEVATGLIERVRPAGRLAPTEPSTFRGGIQGGRNSG
jgi:hypothetical protein